VREVYSHLRKAKRPSLAFSLRLRVHMQSIHEGIWGFYQCHPKS